MTSIWNRLRGKPEERFGLDEAAAIYADANANGLLLPYGSVGFGDQEGIANDFVGYTNGAYKASSVVFAVCQKRMLVFSEMRFQYQRLENGRPTDLFGKQSLSILEKPWPNGTTGDLLSHAIQDVDLCGNAYVVREGVGQDARLRRLRPDWVTILLSKPPDKAVASDVEGYLYKPGGTQEKSLWKVYPVDGSNGAIAHWAPIPDPEAAYRGMSWLTPALRDIQQDKSATRHKLKFFDNAATPNVAVSFKESVTTEQFREFKKMMHEQHGGVNNAYKTMYLGGGADVTVIGARLDQIDFKGTQGLSETRIAACGGVPPVIVGLSEGLQGSSLNEGNFQAARNLFADGTLRPLWRSLCASFNVLVEEFDDARLWYDVRDIEFLRQDQKEQAEIDKQNQATITGYVMQGFEADSARDSVIQHDLRLLKHTGLVSVQLLAPGTVAKDSGLPVPENQKDDVQKAKNFGKKPGDKAATPKVPVVPPKGVKKNV